MINSNNLIKTILDKVSEVEIFSYYLKLDIDTIQHCIESNDKISNPLRIDEHPSLGFKYVFTPKGVKLRATDFANSSYCGDFIDFVGFVINKNPSRKHDFVAILKHIIDNMITNDTRKQYEVKIQNIEDCKLDYDVRKWLYYDYKYWTQFKVPIQYIKEYIQPIHTIHNNGSLIYYYKSNDLCYLFNETNVNNKVLTKFYFPLRNKKTARFITNNNVIPFDAIAHLRYTGTLIIIKSYKDYFLLQYALKQLNILDIDIIPISSESHYIPDKFAKHLLTKYDDVFTLFDFDLQGVKQSNIFRKKYKFKPLFITNGRFKTEVYSGKDFAELLSNSEIELIFTIIQLVYEQYKRNI